jgi:hypothetical protein
MQNNNYKIKDIEVLLQERKIQGTSSSIDKQIQKSSTRKKEKRLTEFQYCREKS